LSTQYESCARGRHQSPIDIDGPIANPKLLPIRFHYQDSDQILTNDGRRLLLKPQTGSFVEVDGDRYDLESVVFHAPSEHKIVGAPYDMELQFVHRSQDGQVLILAVFLEQQSTNRDLSRLWSSIPTTGDTAAEPIPLDPARLLPNRRKYYQYEGSLTHPPCTEGVHWYVLTDPLNISNQQLEHFSHLVPFNARPVQSLNGRKVTRSTRN